MAKGEKTIALNKRAKLDYEILERYEAGIVLLGPEVKSIKQGKVSIKEAYCKFVDGELYMTNMHVGQYQPNNKFARFDEDRDRKLLLHSYEIKRLIGKSKEKGLTIIPLRLFLRGGKVKLEIALAKAKKKYDKREEIKRREVEREMQRELKRYR